MASSLTLLDPTYSFPHSWKHHVFPSFHGEDVRKNFLSHILKEFRSKGIDLFIDNDIERSKPIGPELIEAIKGSRISIVLLSENYTSSTWCLNELVEIMKCREKLGGKQKTDAEMIKDIATDVSYKLNHSAPSSDFDGLVGIESQMTKIGSLLQLDSDEVRKIGILGPPGIGKTSIARSLYNRHSQDFQLNVFIDNIKRKYVIPTCSDDYSVKLYLQKQFMSLLTNETDIKIPHLGIVKDRLKDRKVLVVLDDVDRSVQVEAMANKTCWFGHGSRIIVTTQDRRVLKASGINHIHKVKLPSYNEALQLFCMYAFDKKCPKDGFKELACENRHWTEALPKLKTHIDRDGEIASILKFSYDALNDEDKHLFLHIACFFNGEQVDIVEGCLAKCFLDVTQGLRVLAEKSLVSMESRAIQMAELLVQLGRKIVLKQSVSDPGKRQFLNGAVDIGEVLSDDKADCSSVIGIDLKEEEDISCTSERSFERLTNLQFLRISGNGINTQSLNYISQKLRVLVWSEFQMPTFPSSFNPKFLVKLEMQFSDLEKLWDEIRPFNNLKWMDLSDSDSLEELPDLSTATNLQELDLKLDLGDCSSLAEIPSSIGNAVNLKTFLIFNCSSLLEIPSTIATITNLKSLRLSGCSSLLELPFNIETVTNPMCIDLRCCSSLMKLPSSIGNAIYLQKLDLSHCSSLVKLPSSIGNILSLEELKLSYCSSLVELPSSMKNLVFPAAEVPQCFTYRSSGSSLTVKLNQKPLGISTKFKACIICADGNENGIADGDENGITDLVQTVYCSITSEGNALTACHKRAGQVVKGHLYIFEVEVETEEMTSTELVFEFLVGYWHIYEERINSKTWEIKECGVLQLQEVPLLSIRVVNEDNEPSYTEIGDKPWNPSKTEKRQEKKSKITGASSGI
ncbi:hypothetical protein F2Q69_00037448 [Brassica cretica]|uniref:ADP-ribosyl cyclase/cyclic ADP-ribose hydrolase n=1 Tax=Brassica cretica TaxID=69181 RepID=A0A8S9SNZ1_BRACR|nr:hypothetical protein F2Q69_00037448 [Brassica cretica]